MDWEHPKFNRNSSRVNQTERRETVISYPERSCKMHQQWVMQRCIFILCKKSAEDIVFCGRNSYRRRS